MDDGIRELANAIYREKVERARRMTIEQRLSAGGELFEYACRITRAGIRSQHPEFTEEQVTAELRRRLIIGRKLEWFDAERYK